MRFGIQFGLYPASTDAVKELEQISQRARLLPSAISMLCFMVSIT